MTSSDRGTVSTHVAYESSMLKWALCHIALVIKLYDWFACFRDGSGAVENDLRVWIDYVSATESLVILCCIKWHRWPPHVSRNGRKGHKINRKVKNLSLWLMLWSSNKNFRLQQRSLNRNKCRVDRTVHCNW